MKKLLLVCFSFGAFIFGFQQAESQIVNARDVRSERIEYLAVESNQANNAAPIEEAELRAAAAKAIKLIQQSQAVWAKKETCNSCHHQLLPQIPIKLAREHGVALDEKVARDTTANTFAYLKDLDATVQGYDYIDVVFDGWELIAAKMAGVRPNLSTSAAAQFIASRQLPDGSWPTIDARPPQSNGFFTTTAVCAQAVRTYMPEQFKGEKESRLRRAREWLVSARPRTTEDRIFQLLGLRWTGADEKVVKDAARRLLSEQREDGGWSQLPALASDAYETGQVLSSLHDAAGIPTGDSAYQRGLRFLLKAQEADGSWHVSSRLHPPAPVSPPYFETGFPYQHDQFISTMATSWAAAALLHALPLKAGDEPGRTTPLDIAPAEQPEWVQIALNGSAADLKKLLDAGMKPDSKTAEGTTALMFAARDIEKVKLLTERAADVNARAATGITALMVAARYRGNVETVRLLLKKGAKPNADKGVEVRNDATALFFAVMAGDVQTAGALLDAGARLADRMKVIGRFAQSPLMYGVFLDPGMIEYLIGKGANPNEVDDDKISVLSWATIGNNASMVKSLLARGAQVNHLDNFGMTPLLYAASIDFGDTAVMEKLIAAGADVSAKNKGGLTALDLAKNYRHQAMANLLAGKTNALTGVR
ncbi:MAG TPA: ankyrin repeat domain-containing protein [Blastocatellia bacterium]|nr:ankyrin repeat domain-containing protein [Blastocatellia bacterium]